MKRISNIVILILSLTVVAAMAAPSDPPPGAYISDKIRLVDRTVQDGSIPVVLDALFAVRDSDGLIRQENTGDLFYVRWTAQILKGTTLLRTITKDEPIVPPFNWVQLARLSGAGTEPFVQVGSSLAWDGKNESGQPVPGSQFEYQISAQFIRILPQNNQLSIVGATAPAGGSFSADGEKPMIAITGISNGECKNTNVQISIDITDNSGTVNEQRIELDGQSVPNSFPVSVEGAHELFVFARDAAGNTNTVEWTFAIDRTAPQIQLPAIPACGSADASVDFSATDANLDSVSATLNGTPVTNGSIINTPGNYLLEVTASDRCGNSDSKPLSFVIDRVPPVITITRVENGQFYDLALTPVIESSEGTPVATLNGSPYTPGTPIQGDGEYVLRATVHDCAFNEGVAEVAFTIDTIAPQIMVTPDVPEFTNQNVIFDIQIIETNETERSITLDGAPYVPGTAVETESQHILVIRVNDPLREGTYSRTFTIDKTPPVVTILNPADGSFVHTANIEVDVQDANPDSQVRTVDGTPVGAVTEEGTHTLVVTATDRAGNQGSDSSTFTIDTIAPQITITGVSDSEITNRDVEPQADVNDANPDRINFTLNGNPFSGVATEEGDYTLTAQAIDKAGNISDPVTIEFSIDKTRPVISVTGIPTGYASSPVTPQIAVTDTHPGTVIATLNQQPFAPDTTVTADGTYTLHVEATDAAGNQADPVEFSFGIDTQPPVINIPFPLDGRYYDSSVTPTIQIEEANIDTKTITLDGSAYSEGTTIGTESAHTLTATVTDKAGNAVTKSVQFTIDKTAPVITITGVEADRFYAQQPMLTVNVQEANPESTTIMLDGSPFSSGTQVTTEGRHELRITAIDKANHTALKLLNFGVDTVPPAIHIQTPQEDALLNFDSIQVSGTLEEQFLKEVTVNGVKAIASSDLFVANSVHLNEGSNTITVVATDLAGSSTASSVTVRLDQTPPGVVITSPANGSQVTSALVNVNGTFSGTDVQSVTVNGIQAILSGSQFVASNVRLSEGSNLIRAVAADSAGNTQESSVQVTLDTEGPRIAITKPVDGSLTGAESTEVAGFVFDVTLPSVTVSGNSVSVNPDGSFSTSVALTEGPNIISLIASDSLGNQVSTQINITKDSRAPSVISISPADGSIGVPPSQQIVIRFSEDVKKSTVTSEAIRLQQGSNTISGALVASGNQVTFTPHTNLAGATTFTLSVAATITDGIGNPLQSASITTFSTLDDLPPAPPTIEPELPSVTSDTMIPVAGTAEANSNVEISGGAARVNTLSSETGHYSAEVPLFADAVNQLSVTATDISGNTSAAATATIIQDSIRMVVVDASYELDGSIFIDFSKSVNLASITPQNIYLLTSSTVTGSVTGTADPTRIVFYPQIALNNPPIPFVLKVEASVQDQGGHTLDYPFSKMFNAASGDSFVQGEVWDNGSGQPLGGAIIEQISPVVTPAPVTTADLRGQFVLPVSSGSVLLRITREDYMTSYRSVNAPTGQAVVMFDARLQPADSNFLTLTSAQSTLSNSDSSVVLQVPQNTVTADVAVRLTQHDGQSLPALLPEGWSPVGVATIETSATLQNPVALRVTNTFGFAPFSSMPTAYYDHSTAQWRTGPSGFVTNDGKYLEVQTTNATTHAFLFFDPSNPPPPSLPDQPLQASGSAGGTVDSGLPALVATPTGIYPEQRALVTTTFSGAQFHSGMRFQAILKENFTLLEGLGSVQPTPKTADFVGYSLGAPSSGDLRFFASPSKAIDFTKLDVGFIDVEIHAFPHSTEQPGVIGTAGGSVESSDGSITLTIPAGALNRSVPVTVIPQQVTLTLADYTMVSAFEVNLGGASLSTPATVSSAGTGGVGVPPAILARLIQTGSRTLWIYEGVCTSVGTNISCASVRVSGLYAIFSANIPIGFLTGSITNPQGTAAGANILITSDQNPLAALSNSLSVYTLAVPTGTGTLTAANQVTGDQGSSSYSVSTSTLTLNLQIVTTPPRILSITPDNNATGVSANTAIRVTFSEAILASSLNSASFILCNAGGSPACAGNVPGKILLTNNNTIGVFTPTSALQSDTQYLVILTNAIKDLSNNVLANPTSTHTFRTADVTAPQPASTAHFKLFLPENGNVRFEVPEADIESGTAVIFFNDTKRTSISAIVQNGKYTATIAGSISDTYFVDLVDAANNKTRVDFTRMEYPDGSGAVFPVSGGEYTTAEGIVIEVAADTFTSATPVQIKTVTPDPQTVTPTPRDFANIGYFTLNLNGATAKKAIEVSFPVPQGANITADSQIFAARPVEFFGKRKWMAVEPLKLEDGMLRTQSPPWPGIKTEGITETEAFSLITAEGIALLWGTVGRIPALIEFENTDTVVELRDTYDFIAPVFINRSTKLTVTDLQTGATIFEGEPAPPLTQSQSMQHIVKTLSNDQVPPYVIGGSPLTITSWKVGAAKGNIRANIRFEASDSGNDGVADQTGTITIFGDTGAVPAETYVAIRNNNTGNAGSISASNDGGFTVSVPYTIGDSLTFLISSVDVEPGAALRVNFSEPIPSANFNLLEFYETNTPASKIQFVSDLLSAQQTLEIRPTTNLKSDTEYTLVLRGKLGEVMILTDFSNNPLTGEFAVKFKTKVFDINASASSGLVNDTLLISDHLIVAKDSGIEIYSTANPFKMGAAISTRVLAGGIRSLARYGPYVVGIGGGVAPHSGLLRVFDFSDFKNPVVVASSTLCKFVGSDESGPQGRPIKVFVSKKLAYIATVGIGIQVVDLDFPTQIKKTYDEPNLKDMASYVTKRDDPATTNVDETEIDVLLSGLSMHAEKQLVTGGSQQVAVSFQAIDPKEEPMKLISYKETTGLAGPANNIEILQDYVVDMDQDGRTGLEEDADADPIGSKRDEIHVLYNSYETHDVAFIASGSFGIHVLEITDIKNPFYLGTIKVGDGITVADLKLDAKNLRLYAPVGADGIYIVDVKDPFLVNPNVAPQVIGKIQVANTITDGNVTIDEELNTVYVATRDNGLKSVLVGKLNVEIATDKDNDGKYEHVGVIQSEGVLVKANIPGGVGTIDVTIAPGTKLSDLQAITPTKYYVLAQLPSAAGGETGEVKVKVSATNFFDQKIYLGAGFPETSFETKVRYKAPVDTNNDGIVNEVDGSFRLYVSDPFYITADPRLPASAAIEEESKVIAAGDFVKVEIDSEISDNIDFVTTDLLRQSAYATRAIRMDWIDTEKLEPRQNPAVGSGETDYPALLHSGEWAFPAVDFSIRGRGLDYTFARKYESQGLYDGPLGAGWDHVYFMRLLELPNGDVFWYDGMGRKELFRFIPPNGVIASSYLAPSGQFVNLIKMLEGGWLITQDEGTQYQFNNYGQLSAIQDPHQNRLEFLYNPAGQLSVVLDTMGRPIYYEYSETGKLVKVRDFISREWKFAFDEEVTSPDPNRPAVNLLTSVATPAPSFSESERKMKYRYSDPVSDRELLQNVNLLGITDARGKEFLVNEYDVSDRLKLQQYGKAGETIRWTYGAAGEPVEVTDRNGHVTKYTLESDHVKTMVEEGAEKTFTTSYTYSPDGMIETITTPRGRKVQYCYPRSIATLCTEQQQQQQLPEAERRSSGNITSVINIGTDAAGTQKQLKKKYAYETAFNQVQNITDEMEHVTEITYDSASKSKPVRIDQPLGVIQINGYNKFGQPTGSIDAEGHGTKASYYKESETLHVIRANPDPNGGGYLKSNAVDEFGLNLLTEYKYDGVGNAIEVIDPRGITTRITYNNLDEVVEVEQGATGSADGASAKNFHTKYKYDANGNVEEVQVEKQQGVFSVTKHEYDDLNRPINETLSAGDAELITQYQYDAGGNLINVIYPEGNIDHYGYDERDQKKEETRGFGSGNASTTTLEYDDNGNVKKVTDPKGITEYEYDGLDRLVKVAYPMGNFKKLDYNDDGQMTAEAYFPAGATGDDQAVAKKIFEYDAVHRLDLEKERLIEDAQTPVRELLTDYDYFTDNNLKSVTAPLARKISMEYDAAHRKSKITDAANNITEMGYDRNGNTISVIRKLQPTTGSHLQATEYATASFYDALNRLIETTDPLSHKTQYEYDLSGNLIVTRDGTGNESTATYDLANRKQEQEVRNGIAGIKEEFDYDKNNRLTGYRDGKGNETVYEYDELNRLKKQTYPDNKAVLIGYDGNDNVTSITDRNGTVITQIYDGNNRLLDRQIQAAAGVEGITDEQFSYDALDRMVTATADGSTVALEHDSRGLTLKDIQSAGTSEVNFDDAGNPQAILYPNGQPALGRNYDGIDRLTVLNRTGINLSSRSYLGAGQVTDVTLGNGAKITVDYDPEAMVNQILHKNATDNRIAGFGYQWDAAHNRTQEVLTHINNAANTFAYDGAHRVDLASIHVDRSIPKTRDYGYDAADSIQSTDLGNGIVNLFATGPQNEYLADANRYFVYDSNGNLTSYSDGTRSNVYFYDFANRLVRAQATNQGETHELQFRYDALGRRIEKSVDGAITKFVYDGQQVIQEKDTGGNILREYVWGDAVDELVAIKQDSATYYAHLNSLGSVSAISDSTGKLVERIAYDVFGAPSVITDHEPPQVKSVSRAAAQIAVVFTEEIDAVEITSDKVTLASSGTPQIGFSYQLSGNTLTLSITDDLSQLPTGETLTLTVSGMADLMENEQQSPFTHSFAAVQEGLLFNDASAPDTSAQIADRSTIGNPYLFQGREWDAELGIYHYRARAYDPQLARFLQQDPSSHADSPNVYQAFMSSPANTTDPSGEIAWAGVFAYLGWVGLNTAIDVGVDYAFHEGGNYITGEESSFDWQTSLAENFAVNLVTGGVAGKLSKAKQLRYLHSYKIGRWMGKPTRDFIKHYGPEFITDVAITGTAAMMFRDQSSIEAFGSAAFGRAASQTLGHFANVRRWMKVRAAVPDTGEFGSANPIGWAADQYRTFGLKRVMRGALEDVETAITAGDTKLLMRLGRTSEEQALRAIDLDKSAKGDIIDTLFKSRARSTFGLRKLHYAERLKMSPDVLNIQTGRAWEVTTFRDWLRRTHQRRGYPVRTYEPLLYE